MTTDHFIPFVVNDTQSVQFWVFVDGEPFPATITRECLADKFECNSDFVRRAPSTYIANKTAIDRVALEKHARGEPLVVTEADF